MRLTWITVLLSASAAASDASSWIQPPVVAMWDAQKLAATDFHQVLPAKRDEAIAQLAETAVVAVSGNGLDEWAGLKTKCALGTRPFLVRSISSGADFATLEVRVRGSSILVSNGALGRRVDLQKMPVIACLQRDPQELYVVYSIAQ